MMKGLEGSHSVLQFCRNLTSFSYLIDTLRSDGEGGKISL